MRLSPRYLAARVSTMRVKVSTYAFLGGLKHLVRERAHRHISPYSKTTSLPKGSFQKQKQKKGKDNSWVSGHAESEQAAFSHEWALEKLFLFLLYKNHKIMLIRHKFLPLLVSPSTYSKISEIMIILQ